MSAFVNSVNLFLLALQWLIIIQVILSWIGGSPLNQLTRRLYQITEYLYRPIRAALPTTFGQLDIAPLLALVIIQVLRSLLMRYVF